MIRYIAALLAVLGLTLGEVMHASPVHAGQSSNPHRFVCKAYGYSLLVPEGWHVNDPNCDKQVTTLLITNDRHAVLGVQIADALQTRQGFRTVVTAELEKLGIPSSAIAFGYQTSAHARYDLAVYSPSQAIAGPAITAYVVGTQQHGVTYAFQGFVTRESPDTATLLASQMRDIYYGIIFFKDTSALFERHAPIILVQAAAQAASGSTLLGLGLLLVVCAAFASSIYMFVVKGKSGVAPRISSNDGSAAGRA